MPLCLDPSATFEGCLDSDRHLPDDARPAFVFRAMPARAFREFAKLGRLTREQMEAMGGEAVWDALFAALDGALVSTRHCGAPESLEDLLTIDEAWELYYFACGKARLGAPEKNASASLSVSSGSDAEQEPNADPTADAPRPTRSPSSSSARHATDSAATPAEATETSESWSVP